MLFNEGEWFQKSVLLAKEQFGKQPPMKLQ